MKRSAIIALCIAVTSLVPSIGRAEHSVDGFYTIATTPLVGITCDPYCTGTSDLSIGGYTFAAEGAVPTKLRINDASGAAVAVVVGQDVDGDGFIGEAGEPYVAACATQVTLGGAQRFRADKETSVFVTSFDPLNNGCTGVATRGTLRLTF